MSSAAMNERYRFRDRPDAAPTVRIRSTKMHADDAAAANAMQRLEGLNTMEAASHVAVAITKMKRGITSTQQSGCTAELNLARTLLRQLNEFVIPTLEDAARVSVSSTQRQLSTQPRRRINMDKDIIDDEDDPTNSPYAAVLMRGDSSQFTTSPTILCGATVIMVGVDGPAAKLAMMLARRGIGRLILLDDSTVSKNDWCNSTVFSPQMAGFPRVQAVCGEILRINADTQLEAACVDVLDPAGQTLLAFCLEHGSIVVPFDFDDGLGSNQSSRASSRSSSRSSSGRGVGSAEAGKRGKSRSQRKQQNPNRKLQPLSVFTARAQSKKHVDPPRQLQKTTSFLNRLSMRSDFGNDLGVDVDQQESERHQAPNVEDCWTSVNGSKLRPVIVCCEDDARKAHVVGNAAMEFSTSALFGVSIGRNPNEGEKLFQESEGEIDGAASASMSDAMATDSKNVRSAQILFVEPGVTSCLRCQSSTSLNENKNSAKNRETSNAQQNHDVADVVTSSKTTVQHVPACTGTMFSAAAHAVTASMLCQAILTHFLSNMNDKDRLGSSTWYGNSDMIVSRLVSEPNRTCPSERCRRRQKARRKKLHKMKMKKVMKVSNMFSWAKKKNARLLGSISKAAAQSESVPDDKVESSVGEVLTMTELAAKASARRAARRRR